jgi:UDP-N-acetylglucosamine transferase subunit ALG13
VSEPFVFVTVGTDHHPFDRLVRWVDAWLVANAERGVTGLIQTGTSAAPRRAASTAYLGHAEMEAAVRRARAVVTHGGPGSIMLCSYLGKKPIVVPRRHGLGEHVDDHQVVFSRRLAAEGGIELAETERGLHDLLDSALSRGPSAVSIGGREHVREAVQRFESMADALLREPRRSSRRRDARRAGRVGSIAGSRAERRRPDRSAK